MKIEIKKFIKSILQFIPFTVLLYIVFICIWGNYMPQIVKTNLNYRIGSPGHMFTRLKEAKQSKTVDILFLGSSHAYRGFDSRIFKQAGFNTFNLGSSAQTPIQTEVLLKRYLNELNPKTIIYEVYPHTFSSDGVESSLDIIANDKIDLDAIKMALNQNNMKVYNTLVYGFYRELFNKNSEFKERVKKGGDTYIAGGFVERELQYFKYVRNAKNKWNFKYEQFSSFEKVLEFIKERKIQLILVQAPVTPSLYQSYINNNTFDEKMRGYATYFNFNEIIQLNDSLHFYDSNHLNQTGVEIFNKKLLALLAAERIRANLGQQR